MFQQNIVRIKGYRWKLYGHGALNYTRYVQSLYQLISNTQTLKIKLNLHKAL